MKKLLVVLLIIPFYALNCAVTKIDEKLSKLTLDKYIKKLDYKLADINFNQSEKELYKYGLKLLNYDFDILSAERVFRYLTDKYPNNNDYLYYAGRSIFFIGEYNYIPNIRDPYDIAYSYFTKLVNKEPNNLEYLLMQSYAAGRIGIFIRKKEGGLFSGVNKLQESKDIVDNIIEKNRSYIDAILTRGEVLYESPSILGGDKDEALEVYKGVLKIEPNNIRAHLLVGKWYRNKNQRDKALKSFEKVNSIYKSGKILHRPESDQIYAFLPYNMGQIYEAKKNYDKACELYKTHLQRRNTSPSAYTKVAMCFLRKGKKKEAIGYYKKAIYYDKWNSHSKNMLSKLSK